MSYTFNLASTDPDEISIARVRNAIDDISPVVGGGEQGKDYFLSNERIKGFLLDARDEAPTDANETEIRLWAAAAAEETLAKNQAFVLKKQTTLGESDDGPAVAKAIQDHAQTLAARAWKSLGERRDKAAQITASNARLSEPMGGSIQLIPTF